MLVVVPRLAVMLPRGVTVSVPPAKVRSPAVQTALPVIVSVRESVFGAPLMPSSAPAGIAVAPVPDMVPPVQLRLVTTAIAPAPVRVPERVRSLNVCDAANEAEPTIDNEPE